MGSTILFFTTVFLVYFILNYIFYKNLTNVFDINKKNLKIIIVLFASFYFIGRFTENISLKISYFFEIIGIWWFVFVVHFFFIGILFFIIKKLLKNILTRKIQQIAMGFIITSIIAILLYGNSNFYNTKVTNLNIKTHKQANYDSLNIVFFSDIHLGNLIKPTKMDNVINTINNLKPDIVLIGGDLFDYGIKSVDTMEFYQTMKKLKASKGIYFVNGNHDLFADNDMILKQIQKCGINILIDSLILLDNSIYIIGRQDRAIMRFDKPRKQLTSIIKNIDTSKFTILLDHQPQDFSEAVQHNIDLQLSGHTHNGQFFPISEITKAIYKKSWGYLKEKNSILFVSSGLFGWGPPVRTNSYSEIVNIKIKFNNKKIITKE